MMPNWNAQAAPPPPPPPSYAYPQHAYIPVTVRPTFGSPYPNSSPSSMQSAPQYPAQTGTSITYINQYNAQDHGPPPQEQAKPKTHFPDAVRSYVQRAFLPAHLDPTVSRTEMEEKLKETISHASNSGVMNTIDWGIMPLPQQMIREERARAAQGSAASHPGIAQKPKKRKSDDFEDNGLSSPPSWRNGAPLNERITQPPRLTADDNPVKSKYQKQAEKRQRRGDGGYKSTYRAQSSTPEPEKPGPVVGTSQELEKKYLRLTAMPNPANVRPEHILRQTLELLKKKWRKEANYSYICDQFKSMRQDLTVQRIKNDFTVYVYEIHARIALEKGDLGEYNQCQTQLKAFYRSGLKGSRIEFTAYRILYFIHTANRAALNDAIKDLTAADKETREVKHALDVRSSLALGNYHRFFQLYMDTPNMGAYLMDMFVGRERLAALSNICKAFKPDVRLRFITEELGFESDADAAQFIIDYGGQPLLEERDEYIVFLSGKAGSLFEDARKLAFSKVDIKGQI